MRYFILAILVTIFIGCGTDKKNEQSKPSSPQSLESPPSIPDI